MKKLFGILLAVVMVFSAVAVLAACSGGEAIKLALVTDVGQLNDGSFNEGTWNGVKAYAEEHNITYKYYQPANGSSATDADRLEAMRQAVKNGAEVVVTPGFLQETALRTVAKENPEVKFIFIDGYVLYEKAFDKDNPDADLGDVLSNVAAISYKEQESGYFAGYAAVMEGYTKLGFTGGGGGSNPAVNRYGYGYLQGIEAAAKEKNVDVTVKYSYQYGSSFSASTELQSQISGWYTAGTEVIFSCGGAMFDSVKAAAAAQSGKIIGVDVDQSQESTNVITSAVKGLKESVVLALEKYYAGEWESMGGKETKLGAADDATGLPTGTWSLKNFSVQQYTELFNKVKNGTLTIKSDIPSGNVTEEWLNGLGLTKVTIAFE